MNQTLGMQLPQLEFLARVAETDWSPDTQRGKNLSALAGFRERLSRAFPSRVNAPNNKHAKKQSDPENSTSASRNKLKKLPNVLSEPTKQQHSETTTASLCNRLKRQLISGPTKQPNPGNHTVPPRNRLKKQLPSKLATSGSRNKPKQAPRLPFWKRSHKSNPEPVVLKSEPAAPKIDATSINSRSSPATAVDQLEIITIQQRTRQPECAPLDSAHYGSIFESSPVFVAEPAPRSISGSTTTSVASKVSSSDSRTDTTSSEGSPRAAGGSIPRRIASQEDDGCPTWIRGQYASLNGVPNALAKEPLSATPDDLPLVVETRSAIHDQKGSRRTFGEFAAFGLNGTIDGAMSVNEEVLDLYDDDEDEASHETIEFDQFSLSDTLSIVSNEALSFIEASVLHIEPEATNAVEHGRLSISDTPSIMSNEAMSFIEASILRNQPQVNAVEYDRASLSDTPSIASNEAMSCIDISEMMDSTDIPEATFNPHQSVFVSGNDLPDLGHDGNIAVSSVYDWTWEQYLRVDNFADAIVRAEDEKQSSDRRLLQDAIRSTAAHTKLEDDHKHETLEASILNPSNGNKNCAFTFGDSIDGYEFCPVLNKYLPVGSDSFNNENRPVSMTFDAPAQQNDSEHTPTSDENGSASATVERIFSVSYITPEDFASLRDDGSHQFKEAFIIWEVAEALPVPGNLGLQYCLGNDG